KPEIPLEKQEVNEEAHDDDENPQLITLNLPFVIQILKSPLFYLSIGFGFALGMGMASKINAAAMALVLPFAFFIRWLAYDRKQKLNAEYWIQVFIFLVVGGLATI